MMQSLKQVSLIIALFALTFLTYNCSDSTTGPGADPNPITFDSQAAPGDSAKSFLEGDQYTSLEVEIDYMEGHEPTPEGLDSLKTFLQQRLNKQNITLNTPTKIDAESQSLYTDDDIREIEQEYRDNYTEANNSTLHVYFLVVDGDFDDENPNTENGRVLGIAYWNTSVAFFGQTIEDVSSGFGAPPESKIEGTVFRHEFGHNMGLTGNGSPHPSGQPNHQNGASHCSVDGCLMEPAVETGNFFSNTFDGDIPNLDPLCIEDLQANGGK